MVTLGFSGCQVMAPTSLRFQPHPNPNPHHAQNIVGLALKWLWQGWNVHTLRDSHCPSIKISNNHVQLCTKGNKR